MAYANSHSLKQENNSLKDCINSARSKALGNKNKNQTYALSSLKNNNISFKQIKVSQTKKTTTKLGEGFKSG